jgi:sugar (pentulose or hexulose) kinase
MLKALRPGSIALGIDLGTSSVKIAAVSSDSVLLGDAAAAFETTSELPQQAEQSPGDWLLAVSRAMGRLDDTLTASGRTEWRGRVAAIGLTGQLPTLVCLKGADVVGRAITWKDGRADEWAAARLDAKLRKDMYARTGMPLDGRYLAPMLQFHRGGRLGGIDSILSAKDYLLFALTGLKITEPSTAAGYGVYDLEAADFAAELLGFWGLPRSLLPELRPSSRVAGGLTPAGAALLGLPTGIPVGTGAADSVCATYAMAGLEARIAAISFGSSAVIVGASPQPTRDPHARYLLTPHVVAGWYGREMDLLASGTGYQWLSELFGWSNGELDRSAAQSGPGAAGLTFAPYLAGGEQGALWNPRLFSALLGLSLKHSRSDIARAFLEGVCFELRRCIDVLAEQTTVESICVSGNLVNSPATLQLLADIVQRPLATFHCRSPAALGAALLAGALERPANQRPAHDSPGSPLPAIAPPATPLLLPDPGLIGTYSGLYRQYLVRAASCE